MPRFKGFKLRKKGHDLKTALGLKLAGKKIGDERGRDGILWHIYQPYFGSAVAANPKTGKVISYRKFRKELKA